MKCDDCKTETYIININRDHQKVCDNCYKRDGFFAIRCEIDPSYGGDYIWSAQGKTMYYKPGHFELYELLPKEFYNQYIEKYGEYLWSIQRTCEAWDDPKIYQIEILDDSIN